MMVVTLMLYHSIMGWSISERGQGHAFPISFNSSQTSYSTLSPRSYSNPVSHLVPWLFVVQHKLSFPRQSSCPWM